MTRSANVAQAAINSHRVSPRDSAMQRLQHDPADIDAQLALASLSSPQEAVGQLQAAIRHAPDDTRLPVALGAAFADQRRFPEAADAYRRAAQLTPNDPNVLLGLGQSLLRAHCHETGTLPSTHRDVHEASLVLERGTHLAPTRADLWFYLGTACAKAGRQDKAREAWQRALERDSAGDFRDRARVHLHGLKPL